MNTVTIKDALKLPDKCPIDSIQGQVTEVYKQREITGGKVVQDAMLRGGDGSEIKLTAWDHGDLSPYKGKDVVISAGPKGGLVVKFDSYKDRNVNTLSVSKMVTFQVVAGGPVSANPSPSDGKTTYLPGTSAPAPTTVVNGAKIGMCVNNAVLFMTEAGIPFEEAKLHEIASGILRVAIRLENGDIAVAKEEIPF